MGPRSSASGGVRDIIAASVERTWTAEREAEKPEKPDESARPAVAAASIVPCDEEIGVQIKRHAPTRNLSTSSGSALEILDLGVAPRSRPKRIACTWSLVNRYTARAGVPRAGSPGRHISARNTPCSRPFPARTKVQNPHARTHARTMNDFICAFVCYKTVAARGARVGRWHAIQL